MKLRRRHRRLCKWNLKDITVGGKQHQSSRDGVEEGSRSRPVKLSKCAQDQNYIELPDCNQLFCQSELVLWAF